MLACVVSVGAAAVCSSATLNVGRFGTSDHALDGRHSAIVPLRDVSSVDWAGLPAHAFAQVYLADGSLKSDSHSAVVWGVGWMESRSALGRRRQKVGSSDSRQVRRLKKVKVTMMALGEIHPLVWFLYVSRVVVDSDGGVK